MLPNWEACPSSGSATSPSEAGEVPASEGDVADPDEGQASQFGNIDLAGHNLEDVREYLDVDLLLAAIVDQMQDLLVAEVWRGENYLIDSVFLHHLRQCRGRTQGGQA